MIQKNNENNFTDNERIYIDDIPVFGSTIQEHNKVLKIIMERGEELNVKFNKERSFNVE